MDYILVCRGLDKLITPHQGLSTQTANTQSSDPCPFPMQAPSKKPSGAWTICSGFSCLPQKERTQVWPLQLMLLSEKALTCMIDSYSHSTFQKPVSLAHSLMYKRTDKLCGVVSSSAVPCLLATSQILGHTQASPELTVLQYKIL